jgi:hypothetical protein
MVPKYFRVVPRVPIAAGMPTLDAGCSWPVRGDDVAIKVVAYLQEGVLSGAVESPEHLRDLLETSDRLAVTGSTWTPFDGNQPSSPGEMAVAIDDLVVASGEEEMPGPVHAVFHPIELEAGPYRIRGELATLPGFDPGRALTRPTGTFVLLNDVRVSLLRDPNAGTATHDRAFVNRYTVDYVDSELMLGFFFPGARMNLPEAPAPPATAPAASAPAAPGPAASGPAAPGPAAPAAPGQPA